MSQQINLLGSAHRRSKRLTLDSATAIAAGIGLVAALTCLYGVYEMTQLTQVEAQKSDL